VRNRAIFLVILLASLSAVVASRRAGAASTSSRMSAEPLEAVAGTPLAPPAAAPQWVAAVRSIVARLLAEADAPPAAGAVATVVVDLYDVNGDKSAEFVLPLDGNLDQEQALAVARFFACRRSGRVRPLHPGVIAMLAEVGQRYPGHVIEIVSGYRGTREERRTSPHKAGRAIDLRVRGVRTAEIRDWLWSTHSHVGIGYYPHHDFLHMDTRPDQRDTAWTQPRMNADNDYHPRWARVARRNPVAAAPQAVATQVAAQ
jgi:uncharacterized protein YcbK (DUF882 family)